MDKIRIGVILGYYAFSAFIVFALFYLISIGSTLLFLNNSTTGLIVITCTFLLKKEKIDYRIFTHITIFFSFVTLFILNLTLGGVDSPMNIWFLATILGAGFMLNAKWLFFWGVNVAIAYTVFLLLNLNAINFDFQITLSEYDYYLFSYSGNIGVITLIAVFSLTYINTTQQYSKKLKDSSDRNNILIKILNHDLANPLTIIDAYVRTLDKSTIEKAKPKLLRANQSISDILSSIRSIDKFHTITPRLKDVKLRDAIDEILPEVEELFAEKKLSYKVDINKDVEVNIDAEIFKHQIIKNLLTNASKFSYENGEIRIVSRDNQLSIIDQGIGIPKSMFAHLFEYDKNTSSDGTQGEKGTGFGLPLVKDCCDKMNININVASDSSGTMFNLTFPQKV